MARRKRSRKRATPTRRRRSTAKRRASPVTTLRRRRVYMTNPRRKRRGSRRYHRNPGLLNTVKQGVVDAGATLVGGALARTATGFLPFPNTGVMGAAVGLGVAVGIGMLSRKVVSADMARFLTAGAMQVPLKNLITGFVPQAGAFLGDYDNMGTYQVGSGGNGMSSYLDSVDNPGDLGEYAEVYNTSDM